MTATEAQLRKLAEWLGLWTPGQMCMHHEDILLTTPHIPHYIDLPPDLTQLSAMGMVVLGLLRHRCDVRFASVSGFPRAVIIDDCSGDDPIEVAVADAQLMPALLAAAVQAMERDDAAAR